MKRLEEIAGTARSAVILGHINPDGDCVGACLGARRYLERRIPGLRAEVFLGDFSERFLFLEGAREVRRDFAAAGDYDLCLAVDVSDRKRLGEGEEIFARAGKRVCIDHHITNPGFAEENYIDGNAAAASELLCTMMDPDGIDRETAECLYLGIVHDTGVFKYSNTTERTMRIAGSLLAKGADAAAIIDGTFYRKSYTQNLLLGTALCRSRLYLGGRMILTWLDRADLEGLGARLKDTDGIVDQLRLTEGAECAAFLSERDPGTYKLSLRSNGELDVSRIAQRYGGGGHAKAAGCEIRASVEEIAAALEKEIREWTEY